MNERAPSCEAAFLREARGACDSLLRSAFFYRRPAPQTTSRALPTLPLQGRPLTSELAASKGVVGRWQGLRRVATGLVLAVLLVPGLFLLPSVGVLVIVMLVSEAAMLELAPILRRLVPGGPYAALLVVLPLLALSMAVYPGASFLSAPMVGFFAVGLCFGLVMVARMPLEKAGPATGLCLVALFYLAVPVVSVYQLHRRDPWLVFFVVVFVVVGDILAFYVGSAIGRRRLAPQISPNKSWEGAIASFLGAFACAVVFSLWRFERIEPSILLLVSLSAVAGQFGDLVESVLKRGAGVKDSGQLLPGHGGVLDRFDALFFALPVFFIGSPWLIPEA